MARVGETGEKQPLDTSELHGVEPAGIIAALRLLAADQQMRVAPGELIIALGLTGWGRYQRDKGLAALWQYCQSLVEGTEGGAPLFKYSGRKGLGSRYGARQEDPLAVKVVEVADLDEPAERETLEEQFSLYKTHLFMAFMECKRTVLHNLHVRPFLQKGWELIAERLEVESNEFDKARGITRSTMDEQQVIQARQQVVASLRTLFDPANATTLNALLDSYHIDDPRRSLIIFLEDQITAEQWVTIADMVSNPIDTVYEVNLSGGNRGANPTLTAVHHTTRRDIPVPYLNTIANNTATRAETGEWSDLPSELTSVLNAAKELLSVLPKERQSELPPIDNYSLPQLKDIFGISPGMLSLAEIGGVVRLPRGTDLRGKIYSLEEALRVRLYATDSILYEDYRAAIYSAVRYVAAQVRLIRSAASAQQTQ